ncbi:hypothetical protein [Alkalicoccus saliphilus]|uniref:hypothetical protein n=1 Tax=Alkalicoccus saliphilus TaxID=200989 RepID=UPI001357443C|nr:hypothetical protein [Alkalicoccus saliphilus]
MQDIKVILFKQLQWTWGGSRADTDEMKIFPDRRGVIDQLNPTSKASLWKRKRLFSSFL